MKIKIENKIKLKISLIIVLISIFFPITFINDSEVVLGYPLGYVTFNLRSFSLVNLNNMKYKTILQFIRIDMANMLIDIVIVYLIIKMLVCIYEHINIVYANLKIGQPAHRKVGQYKYKEMEKQIK